jgi:hypothetical protein
MSHFLFLIIQSAQDGVMFTAPNKSININNCVQNKRILQVNNAKQKDVTYF